MGCGGFTYCYAERVLRTIIKGFIGSTKKKGLTCAANGHEGINQRHTVWKGPISLIYTNVGAWIS